MATLWSKLCLKSHYHKDNEVQIKRAWKISPLLSDPWKSYDQQRQGDRMEKVQVSESLTGNMVLKLGSVTFWLCDLVSLPKPLWDSLSSSINVRVITFAIALCINWEYSQSTQPRVQHVVRIWHKFLLFLDPSCKASWIWVQESRRYSSSQEQA